MRTRALEFLRPEEILDEMRRCPAVFLPLAPLEWHVPHLPYGVDPLIPAGRR
jgi:creatinine amidohydrolase